jgi:hypothetical protein
VRLSISSTILGCTGATLLSIQWGTGAQECRVARGRCGSRAEHCGQS